MAIVIKKHLKGEVIMWQKKQKLWMYLVIGVALLTGCGSKAAGADNQTLKITIPGEPMTVDPNKSIETNGGLFLIKLVKVFINEIVTIR
ncbi:hypothetical protein [Bombilactobacillus bombi]|uniref:hypothetical protein n=1 Tax=Bombilactobacillus bombi TaxID=1303590 RepID=UPI00217546B5|nr:hypothetical protein [Bombilactobacillus bombi]